MNVLRKYEIVSRSDVSIKKINRQLTLLSSKAEKMAKGLDSMLEEGEGKQHFLCISHGFFLWTNVGKNNILRPALDNKICQMENLGDISMFGGLEIIF
jgi:hypothetical protein